MLILLGPNGLNPEEAIFSIVKFFWAIQNTFQIIIKIMKNFLQHFLNSFFLFSIIKLVYKSVFSKKKIFIFLTQNFFEEKTSTAKRSRKDNSEDWKKKKVKKTVSKHFSR